MIFVNSNKYGVLEEYDLVQFENLIKNRLHNEYRAYLLKHNGGKPSPNYFLISKDKGSSSIHHMYGVHNGQSYLSLFDNYATFSDRIPDALIPIADDPGGNLICIGLTNEYEGKLYFWDHEEEADDAQSQPFWDNIIEISDSFDNFLNDLYEWVNPDETELERIIRTNNIGDLNILLDRGLDIEYEDQYGRTPIENAAISAKNNIIELLFCKGAKLKNSLDHATNNAQFFEEHKETVELIKKLEKLKRNI